MNGLVARPDDGIVQFSPEQVLSQVKMIQDLMAQVMQNEQHYGIIPGTSKPTLYKAGAEKLNFTFRLAPKFKLEKSDLKDGHREYEIICELYHINNGQFFGAGVGSCSTMEVKYRYREAKRECPFCHQPAIIKGKEEYGGGWVCFKKQKGCGAKFDDKDTAITDQKIGRIENPDLADQYNTILKMAKKRALVDATITACAASDIFFQDLEDLNVKVENGKNPEPEKKVDEAPTNVTADRGEKVKHIDNIMANAAKATEHECPENATGDEKNRICSDILVKWTTYELVDEKTGKVKSLPTAKNRSEFLKFSIKRLQAIYGTSKKEIESFGEDGKLPF